MTSKYPTIGERHGALLFRACAAAGALSIDLAALLGAGLIVYGAWMAWQPLGFVIGGVMLLAAATRAARKS